jgi:hypothetical protein
MAHQLLTANTTFFIRTDGNDANDGLTDSPSGAFLTWQAAYDHIVANYDFDGFTVTMKAGGTGSRTFTVSGDHLLALTAAWLGGGSLIIEGDNTTPANVILSTVGGGGFDVVNIGQLPHGNITIRGFDIRSSARGIVHNGVGIVFIGNMRIGGAMASSAFGTGFGDACIQFLGGTTQTVANTGTMDKFMDADSGFTFMNGNTVVLSGTPTITEFVVARFRGHLYIAATFTGSFAGTPYAVRSEGTIQHDGSISALPSGSVASTAVEGGVYANTFTGESRGGYTAIQFPATQIASSDANALDDYEEGTFTPTLAFGGGTTGITYTTRTGRYTKVGRLVHITIVLLLSSKGSSTGSATITGLPLSAAALAPLAAFVDATNLASQHLQPIVDGTVVRARYMNGGSSNNMTDASFNNTTLFNVRGTYEV